MAAIYSNGGNRWNILGFNFTKRDARSSLYKISMVTTLLKTGLNNILLLILFLVVTILFRPVFNNIVTGLAFSSCLLWNFPLCPIPCFCKQEQQSLVM